MLIASSTKDNSYSASTTNLPQYVFQLSEENVCCATASDCDEKMYKSKLIINIINISITVSVSRKNTKSKSKMMMMMMMMMMMTMMMTVHL